MRIVVQRVKRSSVTVNGTVTGSIQNGYMLLVGIAREDDLDKVEMMAGKIIRLRVFEDEKGKMNKAIADVGGGILSVPQFTLLARTDKGNRPGFEDAADPEKAEKYWNSFNEILEKAGLTVEKGRFGANMQVSLVNDGPVTFVLDS
ncbi:MAG: D-tyrosyl-tRNA(Tyr) deacylase [Candidatus Omnitrophica bacterium]|nr:D-tyrosyl-tRNA(Tyr) deacylase [Candidatus Omnitrophota bacterium]